MCEIAGGCEERIAAIRLAWALAVECALPRRHLVEHRAEREDVRRASASLPSSCSGAMYWNVPRIVPSSVSGSQRRQSRSGSRRDERGWRRLGQAEVQQLHARLRQHDVAGFRSRWTIPCRCALSSASAISIP